MTLPERLLTAGELDIVLSPMAPSWLNETEYLRIEAPVEEVEWTASLHAQAAALSELPLDLDPFLSLLKFRKVKFMDILKPIYLMHLDQVIINQLIS